MMHAGIWDFHDGSARMQMMACFARSNGLDACLMPNFGYDKCF